jgi:hypothetical protein
LLDDVYEQKKFETTRLPELNPLVEACLEYDTAKRPKASQLLKMDCFIELTKKKNEI